MLIDSHIHVGKFYDRYFSPEAISNLMSKCGVDYYAVSSTTQCEEDYQGVIKELEELYWRDASKVMPVMWITPNGLLGNIEWYLESKLKWAIVKVHPGLNPLEWAPKGSNFKEVLDIASELNIPILIHTGEYDYCHALLYESLVADNQNVNFIFAHGRPLNQAMYIVSRYLNAYADSAFMPVEDMRAFCMNGMSKKLLWGTDMCIPKFYDPSIDLVEYYKRKLNAFKKVCTQEEFDQVTFQNSSKLFNLQI